MLNSTFFFQLQNEKRRLERDLEEIKRQKEEQDDENERLRQEVASLRYVFNQRHCYCTHIFTRLICTLRSDLNKDT